MNLTDIKEELKKILQELYDSDMQVWKYDISVDSWNDSIPVFEITATGRKNGFYDYVEIESAYLQHEDFETYFNIEIITEINKYLNS